jgi:hypothetical protein
MTRIILAIGLFFISVECFAQVEEIKERITDIVEKKGLVVVQAQGLEDSIIRLDSNEPVAMIDSFGRAEFKLPIGTYTLEVTSSKSNDLYHIGDSKEIYVSGEGTLNIKMEAVRTPTVKQKNIIAQEAELSKEASQAIKELNAFLNEHFFKSTRELNTLSEEVKILAAIGRVFERFENTTCDGRLESTLSTNSAAMNNLAIFNRPAKPVSVQDNVDISNAWHDRNTIKLIALFEKHKETFLDGRNTVPTEGRYPHSSNVSIPSWLSTAFKRKYVVMKSNLPESKKTQSFLDKYPYLSSSASVEANCRKLIDEVAEWSRDLKRLFQSTRFDF